MTRTSRTFAPDVTKHLAFAQNAYAFSRRGPTPVCREKTASFA